MRSMKFRLILGGCLAALVPLVVVGIFAVQQSSKAVRTIAEQRAELVAANLADLMESIIQQEIKIAREMASDRQLIGLAAGVHDTQGQAAGQELERVETILNNFTQHAGDMYEIIYVLDAEGRVIADSDHGRLRKMGLVFSDRDYFQGARSGRITVGTPIKSRFSNEPIAVFAAP